MPDASSPLQGFGLGPAPAAPLEVELRPAKLSDRFIAYAIDTFPFVAGYYVCMVLLLTRFQSLAAKADFPVIFAACWVVMCFLYQFLGNLAGGTVGKKLMGLAVLRRDGARLGTAGCLVRAFGFLLSNPLFNAGCLVALIHPESRAFHDLISGSVVVEARARTGSEAWAVFLGSVSLIVFMLVGTFLFALSSPTPADLTAVAKARAGLVIFAKIQEQYKAANGTYASTLSEIAQASGDVEQFKSAMLDLYEPHLFQIQAGNVRYRITAAALDRKKTRVTIEGP